MSKLFSSKINKTFLAVIFFLLTFLLAPAAFAQVPDSEIAKKYGITFPIKELGNCNSITNCEAFCDKQENQQSCISFAKSKGFSKQPTKPTVPSATAKNDEDILKLAQNELECNSQEECMAFCDTKDNWRKCADFAKRNGMDGGGMEQMEKAMQQLGCDSPKSCMDYCSNPLNMPKCMQTFKNAGFEVGNYEPIEAWCPKQAQETGLTCIVEGENTCVCTDPASGSSPKEWCEKGGGQWKDEICWFGDSGVLEPIGDWCPKQGPNCKIEGDSCVCSETSVTSSEPIESWCPKAGPDCRVEKDQCVCGGNNPEYPNEPLESWCPKAGADCKVENSSCICGGTTPSDNAPIYDTPAYETPVYSSPESSSTVQGVKTTRGFLPLILDQISSLLSKL